MTPDHSGDIRPPYYDIYLSGPMTGYPEYNFPEFKRVAEQLRETGLTVFCPAETSPPPSGEHTDAPEAYRYYLAIEVAAVCHSKAIALLDGWSASKGAQIELAVARAIGMPVLNAYTRQPLSVGEEAHAYVHGARRSTYGHPLTDYSRTAGLANVRLADYLKKPLDAEACVAFMQMVKVSRLTQTPGHRDSMVDLIGYTLCDELIHDERARRAKDEECTSLT